MDPLKAFTEAAKAFFDKAQIERSIELGMSLDPPDIKQQAESLLENQRERNGHRNEMLAVIDDVRIVMERAGADTELLREFHDAINGGGGPDVALERWKRLRWALRGLGTGVPISTASADKEDDEPVLSWSKPMFPKQAAEACGVNKRTLDIDRRVRQETVGENGRRRRYDLDAILECYGEQAFEAMNREH